MNNMIFSGIKIRPELWGCRNTYVYPEDRKRVLSTCASILAMFDRDEISLSGSRMSLLTSREVQAGFPNVLSTIYLIFRYAPRQMS